MPLRYIENTLRPEQNACHFADDIFLSFTANSCLFIQMSPNLLQRISLTTSVLEYMPPSIAHFINNLNTFNEFKCLWIVNEMWHSWFWKGTHLCYHFRVYSCSGTAMKCIREEINIKCWRFGITYLLYNSNPIQRTIWYKLITRRVSVTHQIQPYFIYIHRI